jgi:mannose-6-phosphate isomerase-like protein (cupin superfamily)
MTSRDTALHYAWGNHCDGWHLLQTPSLSVIEEQMPPAAAEVCHYHRSAHQFFYVLRGALSIEAAGVEHILLAGQGLSIPAGQPHQVLNRSDAPVEFLVVSAPPSHGDRITL